MPGPWTAGHNVARQTRPLPSWADCARWSEELSQASGPAEDWYRIGDGYLGISSADRILRHRFRVVVGECRTQGPGQSGPVVRCTVRTHASRGAHLIRFDQPSPDLLAFTTRVFDKPSFVREDAGAPGWALLHGLATNQTEIAIGGNSMLARGGRGWQPFVGSLAVQLLLALQKDTLFFHAACVAVKGAGALLVGAEASGKTTLSLALAARGHAFIGDELAGVRPDLQLVPCRRAVSIRSGPRATGVDDALRRVRPRVEYLSDGTKRLRVQCRELFPVPEPARLRTMLFLRRFADRPRVEPFTPGSEHLAWLQPLPASLWSSATSVRVMRVAALMSRVRCAFVDLGDPDHTAQEVEQFLEDE